MGDLSDFQTGQIAVAYLIVASVTKKANLLGVSRAAVSKVVTAYTNHGNASSGERNSG
jgi:DNA-binding transcriptional regulator YdaS (Cro superfamily)